MMVDLDKLHEEMKDMSIPNNKMIAWIPLLIGELKASRKVVEAARPLIRGLELCQELGEPSEKLWRKELVLQQALKELEGEK